MKINVLPIEIANMIAAGEVVERPASVVKELVENSVDAGAKAITVEIKKGGITYIRVTDNGCGIEPDEIITAFKRHATSKIKEANDLNSIYTLGFRGEALASIAAVSRVEIFSKTKNSKLGRCAVIEGGEVMENEEAGCSDGTTMIVRNLFYNTPARMKFLKNDATETGYITDVINKLILNRPDIAVRFINNGKTVITSNGSGNLLDSIYTVFGRDYAKNMREVSYSDEAMRVTGYIGNSRLARKDRRHQIFFINSRNIVSRTMSAAVSEAYKNTVMTGRFPVCILKTETDPKLVDVNVHPTKMEVRFSDEKRIYNLIYWAVKNALNEKKYVPEVEINSSAGFNKSRPATGNMVLNPVNYENNGQMEINYLKNDYIKSQGSSICKSEVLSETKEDKTALKTDLPFYKKENCSKKSNLSENIPDKKAEADLKQQSDKENAEEQDTSRFNHLKKTEEDTVSKKLVQNINDTSGTHTVNEERPFLKSGVDFNIIGQVFGTYIILQKEDQMFFIDQHAAHERIYFERLLDEFRGNGIESQMLLLPVTMTLDAVELKVVEQNADFFEQLGFGVEVFGQNSIIVRCTPAALDEQYIKDSISDIITLICENSKDIQKQLCEEALHTVACRRALKGNHKLSEKETEALCEQVLSFGDGINTCPHGRPIMIKMSKYSLEKQFKRIV